jgi:hypothetical protein
VKLAFAQNEVNSFLSVHVQKLFEKLAFGELMYFHFADIFTFPFSQKRACRQPKRRKEADSTP